MARSRSDKMDVDKPPRMDKKYPGGKITKHERKDKASKKAGKYKQQTTSDSSDDESSKATTEEGGAPLEGCRADVEPIESFEGTLGKKQRKKEARLRVEALKMLAEKTMGSSTTASGLDIQAEEVPDKAEREESKRSKAMTATALGADDEEGHSLANDIMLVEPSNLQSPSDDGDEDVDMEDGGASLQNKGSGYTAPPSGMNRSVRRRLKLIERERAKIQKELGVPVGSNDKADEVEQRLAAWNKMFDEKAKMREAKKQDRKAMQTARLQNKRGRNSKGSKR